MKKFDVLESPAAPFPYANVDTDRIIRIERCARVARKDLGDWVFETERLNPDGSPNPGFVLHRPAFRGAQILVAEDNFGCGSSREMAVWALVGIGIRCVIAPSFGEIFFNNCFQNGVLPIRLPAGTVAELLQKLAEQEAASDVPAPWTINLEQCRIATPWHAGIEFPIEPLRREALLEGLDSVSMTLKHTAAIEDFQARQRQAMPWVWRAGRVPA